MEKFVFVGENGIESICGLEINDNVALVTELEENEGVSITNGMKPLAKALSEMMETELKNLVIIERYGPMSYPEGTLKETTYDLVMAGTDKDGGFENARWSRIGEYEAAAIFGRSL